MAGDSDWMPTTWGGKAAMFANVAAKIAGYKTQLGLTDPQIDAAVALCNEYAAVYAHQTQFQAASSGLTEWRDLAMSGSPVGDPLPSPPPSPSWSAPVGSIIGILPTFRDTRDQWLAAPGYTQAIGEDLMIVKVDSDPLTPNLVTPTIQVSAAQSGYMLGVMVSHREAADMWRVQTRQKGQDWAEAGSFTGKSGDVTISPISPGDPEMVEVRVQLRKQNQNYGNLSQSATVTVNP